MINQRADSTQKPVAHGCQAGTDHDREVPEIDLLPADANPAAFVLGLRLGGRGRLKNFPSASSNRDGECALSTSATHS